MEQLGAKIEELKTRHDSLATTVNAIHLDF
jgi:hypothetical protein